jgi:Tfp pilus assembly protein PilX
MIRLRHFRAPRPSRVRRRGQRGVTLIGMLAWAVVVGFVGYVLVRAVPTLLEFQAIQKAIDNIAANPAPTVAGIRNAFDRQKDIEY